MDEGLAIEHDGRVVGVAVRVRGGFMFFSANPELKGLEATVFPRAEMVTQQVAEICRANSRSNEELALQAARSWAAAAVDTNCGNVVRLHPTQWDSSGDPEPPEAA